MKRGNHSIVTWKDAARLLHALRPMTYTTWTLAKIFGKNQGTIYYALHPDKRSLMEKKRQQNPQRREYRKRRRQTEEHRAYKREYMRRWRATKGREKNADANPASEYSEDIHSR